MKIVVVLIAIAVGSGWTGAQERVGFLGSPSRIDWEGVEAFEPVAIVDVVFGLPEAADMAHPTAERALYLEWLERRVVAGYRWAGFVDVEVHVAPDEGGERLGVEVREGQRVTAGPVGIEGGEGSLRERVREALAEDRGDGSAAWVEGGAARFGEGAVANIREVVTDACRAAGCLGAEVSVELVEADGVMGLAIVLENAGPCVVRSVRLEGVDEDEARRALEAVGFDGGMLATPAAMASLRAKLLDLGRFLEITFTEPAADAAGIVDPLVVRVTQPVDLAPWDEMPWAEMATMRRAFRLLAERLARDAHIAVTDVLAESPKSAVSLGPGELQLLVSGQGLRARLPALRLGGVDIGDVTVILTGETGLRVVSSRLGQVLGWRWSLPSSGSAALLSLLLRPADPGDGSKSNLTWMLGFVPDLERRLRDLPESSVIRISDDFACRIELHGATVRQLLVDQRSPDLEGPGELVFGASGDRDAVRIDSATGFTTIEVRGEGLVYRLVDGRFDTDVSAPTDADVMGQLRLVREGFAAAGAPATVVDAVDLGSMALSRLGTRVAAFLTAEPSAARGFYMPTVHAPGGPANSILVLSDWFGRQAAGGYAPESWPHVFARDLPGLVLSPRGRWTRTWTELTRLLREGQCGPLGWELVAEVMDHLGVAQARASIARWGLRRCDFDWFWRDVLALCPPDSPARGVLHDVGGAWRAGAGRLSESTSAALLASTDDLEAAREGLRVIWDAGLGSLLRQRLETLAGED